MQPSWYRYIPVILVMGGIFLLSHQQGDNLDLPHFPQVDKVAHVVLYCLLGLAAYFAWYPRLRVESPFLVGFGVVLFCLVYGFTDEIHQFFIPGRFASGWDLVADVVGGLLAMLAVYSWRCRRPKLA